MVCVFMLLFFVFAIIVIVDEYNSGKPKRELERLKQQLIELKNEGCYKIPCSTCPYLRRVDEHRWACKRTDLVDKINELERCSK